MDGAAPAVTTVAVEVVVVAVTVAAGVVLAVTGDAADNGCEEEEEEGTVVVIIVVVSVAVVVGDDEATDVVLTEAIVFGSPISIPFIEEFPAFPGSTLFSEELEFTPLDIATIATLGSGVEDVDDGVTAWTCPLVVVEREVVGRRRDGREW